MVAQKGNIVKVEYEGRLEDGTVFDSTAKHGGEPLEFILQAGQMIKGFDNAVAGMEVGEEKEVTLQPEDAYGERNPEYVIRVPKENFPAEAKEGMMIGLPMPNGQQAPAVIAKIEDTEVTLDLNAPMAGKVLIFKIKLVEVVEGDHTPKVHECGCGDEACGENCACESEEDKSEEEAAPAAQ